MKKRLLSYIDYVTKEVAREDLDKAAFREQLLIQIHFFLMWIYLVAEK